MAQFVGIDLGAYSVKVVVIDSRFRETKLRGAFEERVPAGDATQGQATPPPPPGTASTSDRTTVQEASQFQRAAATLQRLLISHGVRVEAGGIACLPGERISIRKLELPFGDPRKVSRVIAFELESQIPFDIEEVVYDHVVVSRQPNQTRLLAAAAPRTAVGSALEAFDSIHVDPRIVAAGPLAYAPMLQRLLGQSADTIGLVDIGHSRTHFCVMHKGKPLFARCINRGGGDVTRAIARAYRLTFADAEEQKHSNGAVASGHESFPSADHAELAETCRQGMAPLLRELKQSLAACRAQSTEVTRLLITGGGSQLRNLGPHLSVELGLDVDRLTTDLPGMTAISKSPSLTLASALAIGGAQGRGALVDLRRSEFAYHGDSSALRTRVPQLAAWALVLVACLGINAMASYRSLSKEGELLDNRLAQETRLLFGAARTDARQIAKEFKSGGKDQNPVPEVTAFDLLNQISKAMPDREKVKLDVLELDIKPKKTIIRATAETHGQVDDVAKAMRGIPCFEEVKQGRTQDVGKVKEFTLEIKSRCP